MFAYEYPKFDADYKSVEIIENKCTWKKLLAENFSNREECKLQISALFLPVTFYLQIFRVFLNFF
jgi:hypothetical protein